MNRAPHTRHPSERWGPVTHASSKALDPGFRRGDVKHNPAFAPIFNSSESNA
jgi:hypothetical protein